MHGLKVVGARHEPARPSNRSRPWKSGAEAARTPNADAWSADSAASAQRLECVRFIDAFRPARDSQRFMAASTISEPSRRSMITYQTGNVPDLDAVIELYRASTLDFLESHLWFFRMHRDHEQG